MDLLAEYQEVKQIPVVVAVTYKFFHGFKVEGGALCWAGFNTPLSEEIREPVKRFLKEQRRAVREDSLSVGECSRRMWFWFQKVLDLELFVETPVARDQILRWMEVCELILA